MKPLLPQLRNTLAPGPIQGAWNIHPKSIFAKIAQDLKYEQAVQTSINSIPSPWARALLFQSVFLSDQHPNRKELIYEYIGFLAALAFAKVKELPIEAKQINLRDLSKQKMKKCKMRTSIMFRVCRVQFDVCSCLNIKNERKLRVGK